MNTETKQTDKNPVLEPTPQELETYKASFKKKYGFEPRKHEIAGFKLAFQDVQKEKS